MIKSTDVVEIYNQNYFLEQVDGFKEFASFNGTFGAMFPRYQLNVELLNLSSEHSLLEIGCGRGEVCIYHALTGGAAKGVDYSSDAINLAKAKASSLGLSVEFVNSSFDQIRDQPDSYDRILASEFIEHISKDEGELFFKSAYSMLKPKGKLLVYTMPNTLFRRYGYPVYRFLNALRGKNLPKVMDDMVSEHYRLYHLNEQSYFTLSSFVKQAGFKKYSVGYDIRKISDSSEAGIKRLLKSVLSKTPFRHVFLTNLYVVAEK